MGNDDKLQIKQQELRKTSFRQLSIIRNIVFWVNLVSDKVGSNNAIFARPFNNKNAIPQQLTPNTCNVKSNFHGYGGKSYKCIEYKNHIYLIWIDQISKSIWFQIFNLQEIITSGENKYLSSTQDPKQLSNSLNGNFDASFVITEKYFLYGICEIQNRDYLFNLNLEKTKQEIRIIKKFDNFAGDLASNQATNLLSWIEWDTPYMPWEKNDLFFAEVDIDGGIRKIKKFFHNLCDSKIVSFFQPFWISDKILLSSEDSSGWWNLIFIEVSDIDNILIKKRIKKSSFEYGCPQWVSGITFFSGSINNLFCLAKKDNNWIIEQYRDLSLIKEFHSPLNSVSDFSVFNQKIVLKGYGSNFSGHLFEIDIEQKNTLSNIFEEVSIFSVNECSKPDCFWFKGFDNRSTHSFIYEPIIRKFKKPPLLLRAHSGPTSCFDGSYNSEVQYWTSKGFLVAEVNYGGSSGFGRKYRERLNGKWGILDSYDCKSLVIELLKLNLVDSEKIAIFGNSAGGLTALNSLCCDNIFKAAVCKYPVLDLSDMHHNTHRFEKDYLNSLIGNYEELVNQYLERSPINKIKKTKKPILLFHGKKDSVISYKQALKVQDQMRLNNKYSEVIFFENENHGFKNIETKQIVLKKTEDFLRKTFNI